MNVIETLGFRPGSAYIDNSYLGLHVRMQELECCGTPGCDCKTYPLGIAFCEQDESYIGLALGPMDALDGGLEETVDDPEEVEALKAMAILFGMSWPVISRAPVMAWRRMNEAGQGCIPRLYRAPHDQLRTLRKLTEASRTPLRITDPVKRAKLLTVLELPYDFRN